MKIDLMKLTPAPWFDDGYRTYGPTEGADKRNGPVLFEYKNCFETDESDGPFIALARNAFDVMMRRGWIARRHPEVTLESRWHVDFISPGFDTLLSREQTGYVHRHADPFTALVEADAWYKSNVEKEPTL